MPASLSAHRLSESFRRTHRYHFFNSLLTLALGQPFVVENRSGAAGAIGGEAIARSPKDGYSLLAAPTSTMLIVPNLRSSPYGLQDFVAVARMADAFSVIGASRSAPFHSMKELVEYGRKNPGKINYASAGVGSIQHLRLEAVNRAANIGMVHIPYKGTAEALSDLISGQIEIMTEALLLPQIRAGKVQGLAFMDDSRHPEFPDMPTMKEASAGLPFENLSVPSWFVLFAPVGAPDTVVRKLNASVVTGRTGGEAEDREQDVCRLDPRDRDAAGKLNAERPAYVIAARQQARPGCAYWGMVANICPKSRVTRPQGERIDGQYPAAANTGILSPRGRRHRRDHGQRWLSGWQL
jgi:tripartite-type tricarboxylate transporter receptor subunit TctC